MRSEMRSFGMICTISIISSNTWALERQQSQTELSLMFHALRTDTLFMRIKRVDLSNCVFHIVNGITRLDIERNCLHATTQTKYQITATKESQ